MKKNILVVLLTVASIYITSQVNLSQSLTACYSLNGNGAEPINNLTGNMNAITATTDRFNNPNSACYFGGSQFNLIVLPNSPLLKSLNAMSFSCWVKPFNVVGGSYLIYTKNNASAGNAEAYSLEIKDIGGFNRFVVRKGNNSNSETAISTTTINLGTWYHVAASINNVELKMYVNGNLENTTPSVLSFDYMAGKGVVLGNSNESFTMPYGGAMDNLRFYNRTLNASEVTQLFSADPACNSLPSCVSSFSTSTANSCINQIISLTDVSSNVPTSWSWQLPGATPSISSVSNPIVSYPVAGIYTISLIASNINGSAGLYSHTVSVSLCTTINEVDKNNTFSIYPNPTSGEFTISTFENINEIEVYDLIGQVIFKTQFAPNAAEQIDLNDKPNGIYFIKIKTGEQTLTRKVIKE